MSEQVFVFSSQIALLGTVAGLVSLYTIVLVLSLLSYTYAKLKELFRTAIKRADSLGAHVTQVRSTNNKTKVIGV